MASGTIQKAGYKKVYEGTSGQTLATQLSAIWSAISNNNYDMKGAILENISSSGARRFMGATVQSSSSVCFSYSNCNANYYFLCYSYFAQSTPFAYEAYNTQINEVSSDTTHKLILWIRES